MNYRSQKLNKSESRNFVIIDGVKLLGVFFLQIFLIACQAQTPPASQVSKPETNDEALVQDYKKRLAAIEKERGELTLQYQRNTQSADAVENARHAFVRSVYREIIPFWYETEWDFYGMTETPQEGKIACGYFVTTVLRDAGLKIERARLAQQASERIILSLTTENHVKRFRNASLGDFVAAIDKWGEGLYIVGLDFHVGFIVNDGEKTYFIHSSYIEPRRVVREAARDSKVLATSKYRVAGKISADDALLAKWLLQKNIPTR